LEELAKSCDLRFAKDSFLLDRAILYLTSQGDIFAPDCLNDVLLDPIGWFTEFLAFFIRDDGKEIVKFQEGVCSLNDIKDAFQHKYDYKSPDYNLPKLMSVLCELDLCMQTDAVNVRYLFPCLLPEASREYLNEEWAKSVKTFRSKFHPLVFKVHRLFSTKMFLPPGIFSKLLIRLSKKKWPVEGKKVYRNWAKWMFKDFHLSVSVYSEKGILDLTVVGKNCGPILDEFAFICRRFIKSQCPDVELKESWLCPSCLSHRDENIEQDWAHAIAVEEFSVSIEKDKNENERKQVAKLNKNPEDYTCLEYGVSSVFQPESSRYSFGKVEAFKAQLDKFRIFRSDLQKGKDKEKNAPLGEGHFSKVYEMEHKTHGCVAVKTLRNEEDLLREMFILRQLNTDVGTEYTVKFHGICLNDRKPQDCWLVMQIAKFGSLESLFSKRCLQKGCELRREVLLQKKHLLPVLHNFAEGMNRFHSAGYIHRNLEIRNLLMTEEGKVLISDYGLVRSVPSGFYRRTVKIDTPQAPESLPRTPGNFILNHFRTDVWAFGVTAYEIVTGDKYQPAAAAEEVQSAFKLRLPLAVATLITGCVDRDPRKRPSAQELDVALRKACKETTGASSESVKAVLESFS